MLGGMTSRTKEDNMPTLTEIKDSAKLFYYRNKPMCIAFLIGFVLGAIIL